MVHQRDEVWLEGNARSRGSIDAAFKLRHAEPLPVKEFKWFFARQPEMVHHPQVPINFDFDCIIPVDAASAKTILNTAAIECHTQINQYEWTLTKAVHPWVNHMRGVVGWQELKISGELS